MLGTDPRMSFRIVISTVNEVHCTAHNQSSTQNYVQDKIKMLPKSSFVVFPNLVIRHTKKKQILNRIVIFPTAGSFLRKLFKVQ